MAMSAEEKRKNKIDRLEASLIKKDGRLHGEGRFAKRASIKFVASDFQKLVRLRAADRKGIVWCYLCDTKRPFNHAGMHGSHYYSSGAHANTIFDEMNVHPGCRSCNEFLSGNIRIYQRWMEKTYTKKQLAGLLRRSKIVKQWTYRELAEMKIAFLDEIKIELVRIENREPPKNPKYTLLDYENNEVD